MNIILYHAGCTDGFGAAFAAWLHIGSEGGKYLPVRYGDPVPEEVWDTLQDYVKGSVGIYILDFSYPIQELERLRDHPSVQGVVVLDHHATARGLLASVPPLTVSNERLRANIDESKSGAVLAWEYFDRTPPPAMFLYLQDYDLWKFELPHSREINAMIARGSERTFPFWEVMLENWHRDTDVYIRMGASLLGAEEATLQMLAAEPDHITGPGGELALRVNSPILRNELGERLMEAHPLAEYAEIWYERRGERRCSLRSRKGGCDVSRIAERYGGGGHPSAAAYRRPACMA